MHRTTQPRAIAGTLAHEFGHHQLHPGALGKAVPMTAMIAADVIIGAQVGAHTDGNGLLADIAMRSSLDRSGDEQLGCLFFE